MVDKMRSEYAQLARQVQDKFEREKDIIRSEYEELVGQIRSEY